MMTCPECGGKTKVFDISHVNESVYRRKRCTVCNYDFYTLETVVETTTVLRATFREYNRNAIYQRNEKTGGRAK